MHLERLALGAQVKEHGGEPLTDTSTLTAELELGVLQAPVYLGGNRHRQGGVSSAEIDQPQWIEFEELNGCDGLDPGLIATPDDCLHSYGGTRSHTAESHFRPIETRHEHPRKPREQEPATQRVGLRNEDATGWHFPNMCIPQELVHCRRVDLRQKARRESSPHLPHKAQLGTPLRRLGNDPEYRVR